MAVVEQHTASAGSGLGGGDVALVVLVLAGVEYQLALGKHSGHGSEDIVASAVDLAIVESGGYALAAVEGILAANELAVVKGCLGGVVLNGQSGCPLYIGLVLHGGAALGKVSPGGRAFLGAAGLYDGIGGSLHDVALHQLEGALIAEIGEGRINRHSGQNLESVLLGHILYV